jgi:hypothetical protein
LLFPGGLLLDAQLLGPALAAQVQLLASFDTCNLKHLSVQHLVTAFLPRILPRAWQHKRVVSWTETTPDGTQAPPATW